METRNMEYLYMKYDIQNEQAR